jgi:hypothetical protein
MKRAALALLLLAGLAHADAALPTPAPKRGDAPTRRSCSERLERAFFELRTAVGKRSNIEIDTISVGPISAALSTPDETFSTQVDMQPGVWLDTGWQSCTESGYEPCRWVAGRRGEVHTSSDDPVRQQLAMKVLGRAVDDCLQMLKEGDVYDTTFTGTIQSVEIGRAPEAIAVDFDARWLVRVDIQKLQGDAPFKVGGTQTFAIHSPSRFFMGDAPVGKKITMRLTGPNPQWHLEIVRSRG